MTRRLVVRPEASAHIAEAFSWYQAQRDDLGWELKAELNAAFRLVQQAPEAGPVAYRGLRRMLLNRFPYAVYYTHAGAHRGRPESGTRTSIGHRMDERHSVLPA